jgi:hypothetical protein
MTDWALAVKHKSFSEEKEWRVVTYPKDATLRGTIPENYEGVSIRPTSKFLLLESVLHYGLQSTSQLTVSSVNPPR